LRRIALAISLILFIGSQQLPTIEEVDYIIGEM